MTQPHVRRLAVVTSGGDAPGMNAAIRAVTRRAVFRGLEVFGVRNGFAGLIAGDFQPLGPREGGGESRTRVEPCWVPPGATNFGPTRG